ncbi:putative Histidine kinase [Nitrospira sp. KM1]|uniref:ATP-binding protein n=1 Tax=Nitrospira sp. KM1 TaxID=1936990 RepID=UPI0013A71541|nr:ATP-binding protein [Nitrospira sp. KM1]BCA53930.1 putative Histidine kinase [Nitrospira sp. KM1]
MPLSIAQWWDGLRIQHKVWTVLLLLCVPLFIGLTIHLYVVNQLLSLQQQRQEIILDHAHVHHLRRLTADIEGGFRGYMITQDATFLTPLHEAESKIDKALSEARLRLNGAADSSIDILRIEQQLKAFLRSKHELIAQIQSGRSDQALTYVRSGEGMRLSDRLREDLGLIEDRLDGQRIALNIDTEILSQRTFVGLWIALGGVVMLGWISSRMLARSLTDPISRLRAATGRMGNHIPLSEIDDLFTPLRASQDELGQLAHAYLEMARRIHTHVDELEVLITIGQDINTIGPDGLDGVLRRILDRAVELIGTSSCLVLIRDERMGCWVVEAASGEWNDRLKKSVMLWEELPVCVLAFESGDVATGDQFRADRRPHVVRRNLIGDSMLAIPLMAQGVPFGVLSLINGRDEPTGNWNIRLAKGLAQQAALAIANARLYDAVQEKQRGLLARLRHLESLAETLAHDLKGPGARMEELARLLAQKFTGHIDERTAKWLRLIQENGSDIVQRVEGILAVARVGSGQGPVTAVDPALVIEEVLKAHAGEIERLHANVEVGRGLPLVACHGAYLRQVFDNLLSNALKYSRPEERPVIDISARIDQNMACFTVRDRGIGIPESRRSDVFKPFIRLAPGNAPGSGIGLAIVQRIVELYGGRVWIEAATFDGCAVRFTVPCLKDNAGAAGFGSSRENPAEIVDGSIKGFC